MENRALPSPVKVERRIIEKNRRNQMKFLFHKLHSVLPSKSSEETLPVVDQVDEAIKHIKFLQTKVNKSMEKKNSLMGKKRSYSCSNLESSCSQKSPQIKIREMGSALEVFLTSGVDNQFMLQEIIQILHQERAEIVHVGYSVVGSSVFHTVHAEMKDDTCYFGAAKISEKLNRLVYGSISDVELQPEWWDFNSHPDDWSI